MAEKPDGVEKPRDWDKAISVAYLRLCKTPQTDAAKQAGVGVRTIRRWEKSGWWPEACFQASSRWLRGLVYVSQQTVFEAIKGGDAHLAFKVIERQIQQLAPPRQQLGVQHSGVVATTAREMTDEELLERAGQLANRVTAHMNASRNGGHSMNGDS